MKQIRIGAGSGGCAIERMEPTLELLEYGALDYIVFECLAERTMAEAQKEKQQNPAKGYNPMLEERMRAALPLALARGTKIISNMGGANTAAAVDKIEEIARELKLKVKIAMVTGDDLTGQLGAYQDAPLLDRPGVLRDLDGVISANAYLSGDPIAKALDEGADVVITGRVADPALFVGPLKHEFGWSVKQPDKLGQALLLGHLLECAAQLTGGYYADPGYKDVPDLHILGQPIAQIDETGKFIITKVPGSGGLIRESICREQLLYEIDDPAHYITPDGIADFSRVTFTQMDENRVLAEHGSCKGEPDTYKVNIGYQDCWVGFGEISYGGSNALARARLAADIVQKRWQLRGITPDEVRVDYIGYNSLYGEEISAAITPEPAHEIRLRITVRTQTGEEAEALLREVQVLYINGPAGGGGIFTQIARQLSVDNILVPRKDALWRVTFREVYP